MEKPTFKDIVEFAKAGWKPSDVKEVMEAASKMEAKEEAPAEITPKEDVQPEQENSQKKTSEQPKQEEASDDIKKELEMTRSQLADAKNQLKAIQEQNTKKDLQGTVPSETDRLEEIARSFM